MNTYQHSHTGNNHDMPYNNGIHPILPPPTSSSSASAAAAHLHLFHKNNTFRNSSSHGPTTCCPVIVTTYITLHLDTTLKILNHILYLTLLCDVMLLLSSFSISYFNNIGYNTVLCNFILCIITIITLLIINNNHISALSIFAPTPYMIGVATGLTLSAIVITFVVFTTYQSTIHICKDVIKTSASVISDSTNSTDRQIPHHYYNDDPVLLDACQHHASTMSSIRFWSSFIGWCNVMTAALLIVGRHELSAHTAAAAQYAYDPIVSSTSTFGGGSNPPYPNHHNNNNNNNNNIHTMPTTTTTTTDYPPGYDFEEQFRRQQAQILGVQGVAAIQQRATAMFVGDYSTIPEVTQPRHDHNNNNNNNNNANNNGGPQILSV